MTIIILITQLYKTPKLNYNRKCSEIKCATTDRHTHTHRIDRQTHEYQTVTNRHILNTKRNYMTCREGLKTTKLLISNKCNGLFSFLMTLYEMSYFQFYCNNCHLEAVSKMTTQQANNTVRDQTIVYSFFWYLVSLWKHDRQTNCWWTDTCMNTSHIYSTKLEHVLPLCFATCLTALVLQELHVHE